MSAKRKSFAPSDAWTRLRRSVLRRDKHTCRRCLRKFRHGQRLTVHHIIPRPQGATTARNLISLCGECHNFIEVVGFHTIAEIEGRTVFDTIALPPIDAYPVEDWRDIDWRIRVYGGATDYHKAKALMVQIQLEQER